MKKLLLLVCGVFSVFLGIGQISQANSCQADPSITTVKDKSQLITFPFITTKWLNFYSNQKTTLELSSAEPFCSIGIGWSTFTNLEGPGDFHIQYRYKTVSGNWSAWQETHGETAPSETPTSLFWSHLIITDYFELADSIEIDFGSKASDILTVRIDISDISGLGDGHKPPKHVHPNEINPNLSKSAQCPEPKYVIPRSGWWGNLPADELDYPNATNSKTVSYNTNTTHAYIHHGASSNNYTSGASVVRGYWSYHVNSKGWKDIGYNYVMDKFANLYLARHNPDWPNQDCWGAHTGSSNPYSFATCFAGNYESLYPPQETLDSLQKLLAWKCDLRGMDPVGQGFIVSATIDIISGHRDAPGSSTACPGDSLYAKLPDVRVGTKALLDACDLTPLKPTAFCALRESSTEVRIIVAQDTLADDYLLFQSPDGITFSGPTVYNSNNFVVSGLTPDVVTYFKLQASSAYGVSDSTEVLAAVASGNVDNVMVVNGFDRGSGGNTYDFIRQHGEAISNYGYSFSSATNEAVLLGLVKLRDYEIVDYILGEESTVDETFDDVEQDTIEVYLQLGGKLFVSGAEIGWDLDQQGAGSDQAFYNNFLKADYTNDAPNGQNATHYSVLDVAGEIFDGLGTINFDDGTNGTYDVNWPDVMDTIGGSEFCMEYATALTEYAGIRFEGVFPGGSQSGKLVNLGVPFETFYPETARNQVMSDVLDYFLDAVTGAPSASPNVSYCDGDVISDVTASPNSGGTITWYDDPGLTNQIGTGTNYTPSNTIGETTYYATETVATVESLADSVKVTIYANPTASTGADGEICEGETYTITATGGVTYTWDNGFGLGASHNVSPSTTTTYTVTVTENGCFDTGSVNVTVHSNPVIDTSNIAVSNSDCGLSNGQILNITATGTGSLVYNWENVSSGSTVATTDDATGLDAGTYQLTVTDDNCSSTTFQYSVYEENPTIPVASGDGIYCEGDVISDLTATVGIGTINWYDDVGLTNQVGTGTTFNPGSITVTTTYYVAETQGGCESSADSATVVINPSPVVDAGLDTNICNGDSTILTAVGGVYQYWSTNDSSVAITVQPTVDTEYFVTITDGLGCSNVDSVQVDVNIMPTASISGSGTICNGESITITASGGSGYAWSTGDATASITVSPASDQGYSVTVTEVGGCFDTTSTTIFVNQLPNVDENLVTVSNSSCGGSDGSVTGITASGSGAITYLWFDSGSNNVGSVADLLNVPSGGYTLSVTDDNCSNTSSVHTVVENGAPGAPSAGSPAPYCDGDAISDLTASGTGGTLTWYSDPGLTTILTTGTTYSPAATTANYYVTETQTGCESPATVVTVTVNPLPNASAGVDTTICELTNVILVASGGVNYAWDNGVNTASNNVSPTVDTEYIVTVTDANNCTNSDTVEVFIQTAPISSFFAQDTINIVPDYTEDFTSTAQFMTSVTWNFDDGNTSILSSPTHVYADTGSYNVSLIATNAYCEGDTSWLTVSVIDTTTPMPPPAALFTITTNQICFGDSVQTVNYSTDAASYEWYFNGGLPTMSNDTNPAIYFDTTGIYSITLIALNPWGTDTTTAQYLITVYNDPVADFETNDTLVYVPNADVQFVNNSTDGTTYFWDFGDGNTSTAQDPLHTYQDTGWYDVSLIVSNGICPYNDVLSVTNVVYVVDTNTTPVAAFNAINLSYCIGDSVLFQNQSLNADSFAWSIDGTYQTDNTDLYFAFGLSGTYDVELIAYGLTDSDTLVSVVNVTVLNNPVANFTSTDTLLNLPNGTAGFNNTSIQATSYYWDFGDGNTSILQSPWNDYINSGTYNVTLIVQNQCGSDTLSIVDYITVTNQSILPTSDFTMSSYEFCLGDTIYTTNNSVGAQGYTWFFFGAVQLTSNAFEPVVVYNTPGQYNVSLVSSNGAGTDTLTQMVNVLESPIAGFVASDTVVSVSSGIVGFNNTSQNATGYYWDFGDGNASVLETPWNQYTTTGEYTITLIATNEACPNDTLTAIDHITITEPLGVEVVDDTQLKVYPNPVSSDLVIEGLKNLATDIKLYSVTGQLVARKQVQTSQKVVINTENLTSGVYLLEISTNDSLSSLKIVKE